MSKKGKKGKKKIAGLMLFLGWMIFILLAVVFYFYFIHCVQIATEHILSVEAMCGFFDYKGYDKDGCT